MKKSVRTLLAVTLLLPFNLLALAQTPAPQKPQDDEEVVRVESQEVKLDVVVKDKRGRPVKDLKPADFEVYEDGVRQQIQSFRFVTREAEAPAGPGREERKGETTTALPAAGPSTPGVVALVFDRLSPEARSLARKAGLSYAQDGMAGGDFTGVFVIDQSLRTLQSFTDDAEQVRQAVERATGANSSSSAGMAGAAKVRDMADRGVALQREIDNAQAAGTPSGPGQGAPDAAAMGQASIDQKFNEMETSMLEQYRELERDQQGYATVNALLAVINPMRRLPGRKTLIFFSEGLTLPTSVMLKFQSVISAANKANVSIYAIDAAGLRVESGTAEAARELNSLAAQRMQQAGRSTDSASGPYMKALEKNEDLLRLDPRGGLGVLASETGGFLIRDTNDLTGGLRRINDDMHGYYLLTYVPRNTDFDGRFRQINVKLPRADFEVQARRGYYAVESTGQFAVLDFEAPALAAAHAARAGSNAFPFRAGALSFPAPGRAGTALVMAEAPISSFTFSEAKDKKTYGAAFSVVALVKDRAGRVVQKLSQHYPLSGPADKLDAAKKGELLFYRETVLPPGSYTVEFIGYDALGNKASVGTSALEIPNGDESKPRLSSVSVLKRGERLTAEEQKQDQPFHFGELLVYPNLGEPVAGQLAFFFTAWPAKGSTQPLRLTLEISQGGRGLFRTSGELPASDARGQIKYASSFPLEKFRPGVYELKVTVGDGKDSVSQSTNFTVAP